MTQDIQPFDWQRIWLGDMSWLFLLEVAFRTGVMFVYTLLAARIIGKRGIGQLTPFEFIVVIVLGSAAGDPMFYPDVPLLHGITVITVVVLLEQVLSFLTKQSRALHNIIESTPVLVIKNGKIQKDQTETSGLSDDEIMMQLRLQGIQDVSDVKYAFFEPSGGLSIFKDTLKKNPSQPTLPMKKKEQ